jgi:hypothetical protein
VVLADRGFARAPFLAWLPTHGADFVVRVNRGTCLTDATGHRWRLGTEGLAPGEVRWAPDVRFGLYHDRPRDLVLHVALCWRLPKARARDPRRAVPTEPWYLATSLRDPVRAAAWYWQRGWIEQHFKALV